MHKKDLMNLMKPLPPPTLHTMKVIKTQTLEYTTPPPNTNKPSLGDSAHAYPHKSTLTVLFRSKGVI